MTGATTAPAQPGLRIDPAALPARYTVSGGPGAGDASVYLDSAGVIMKRRLSGLPLTLCLPIGAYRGVAVRLDPQEDGGLVATVELLHRDPALTLPLGITRDVESAADDWRTWSTAFGLPMLLVMPNGSVETMPAAGSATIGTPSPRRRRGELARRPRFLVRRKPGHAGHMPVITGREIIART